MGGGGGGRRISLVPALRLRWVLAVALVVSPAAEVVAEGSCSAGGRRRAGLRDRPPHGRRFPGGATGRLCDGRLIIDFLCESLKKRYLSPYLEALGSDFAGGANFAIGGARTLPRNVPFSLSIQVLQFLRFRSRSLGLLSKGGAQNLIDEEGFKNALYMLDIGQNDLSFSLSSGRTSSPPTATERIPAILAEIKSAITTIYWRGGGRRFWVHGTGPLGCLPQKLVAYSAAGAEVDAAGCLAELNAAARAFNDGLKLLCEDLAGELPNAAVVFTDLYAIKYALIADHASHGFESPLKTCCGYGGGVYNYNPNVTCGNPGSQACPDGGAARFLSWDGVHFSEAANAAAAAMILTADFSKPRLRLDSFCSP
ncbi:unnamed protein product [Spirodela intermedia]|uniref:Uncharacterized protein n=1 Tax=Spirodela intermedia TaxID=51605 RepID=A0A7I8I8A7_SPIIN|nr:unnamed protein product [Spirodela intermedia]CAA6653896.1 unnamed protein product [Spirodela intermedia]